MTNNVLPDILDVNVVSPDPLPVELVKPIFATTAFGELSVAQPTPVVQMAANYGLTDKAFSFITGTGSTTAEDSLFKASTGVGADSFATLLTNKQLTYRPGQGALARLTALYTTGVAGSTQVAGLITATDSLAFGYQDADFGIFYAHSGKLELQTLTVTAPAGGAENATITIDGVAYVVPLTAGTVQDNAYEISQSLNSQISTFDFTSNDDTVVSMSILAGPAVGAYAFTSATAVAAWVQDVAGVTTTNDFIIQSSWNRDVFAGLDPTKGNVYQIKFQYLGFGGISFYVENPVTTEFDLVHVIEYANSSVLPSVTNPSFRLGWSATNDTNTTDIVVSGASVGGFIEGEIVVTEDPRSLEANILGLGTVFQLNLLTIRNRIVFGNQRNRAQIFAIKIDGLTESSKGAIMRVVKNADITGDLDYQYLDEEMSIAEFATDNGIVTGGKIISSVPVSTSGVEVDLDKLDVDLQPGETLTVSMRTISGGASDAAVTISFREDL